MKFLALLLVAVSALAFAVAECSFPQCGVCSGSEPGKAGCCLIVPQPAGNEYVWSDKCKDLIAVKDPKTGGTIDSKCPSGYYYQSQCCAKL